MRHPASMSEFQSLIWDRAQQYKRVRSVVSSKGSCNEELHWNLIITPSDYKELNNKVIIDIEHNTDFIPR